MHRNAALFPNSDVFMPSRWLADEEAEGSEVAGGGGQSKDLEKYLVPFSRGARMCLGFNLGWAELRLLFAHVFRKFELEVAAER